MLFSLHRWFSGRRRRDRFTSRKRPTYAPTPEFLFFLPSLFSFGAAGDLSARRCLTRSTSLSEKKRWPEILTLERSPCLSIRRTIHPLIPKSFAACPTRRSVVDFFILSFFARRHKVNALRCHEIQDDFKMISPTEILSGPSGGQLEKPSSFSRWGVPAFIDLRDDRLVYRWFDPIPGASVRGYTTVGPGAGLVKDFINLADAADDHKSILNYARRWGVLRICAHALPLTHGGPRGCPPLGLGQAEWWEPISIWRLYSRHVRAMVNIAARLCESELSDPADWKQIYSQHEGNNVPWWDRSIEADRGAAKLTLLQWSQLVNPGNGFLSSGKGPLLLDGGGLYGALLMQLWLYVDERDGIAICFSCTEIYTPKRRPRNDQDHYCPRCRNRNKGNTNVARKYRLKKKSKMRKKARRR